MRNSPRAAAGAGAAAGGASGRDSAAGSRRRSRRRRAGKATRGGGGAERGSGEDGAEAEERAVVCIPACTCTLVVGEGAPVAGSRMRAEQNIQLVGPAQ